MADYHLLAIWRIEAPLEQVYLVIQNTLCWPEWWPGVQKVEQVEAGDADGINNTRIMAQGAEGLARRLGARLVSQESIDLTADNVPSRGEI
ncbi:SRPBCC family protein [Thiocapsa rosea]|uniref:Polyketide cyclase/dehydrase/lipid transport protein n=1 Tax=Thiocapsa rosea TaxID=69360 RepID=A0A495VC72_9GAMM|nr:SRPBCC family protein [Thiocapsa rosea]RKT46233.1 polyketide cyclase/dehydrase/lipid transport protein [Thiocapsa rosea]